ncbi:SixA phosphatase family protein [Belliella kenyensis]|uniref:SixA phosphatase family protein n=1 Tax=Belliella kenyensis TaxID=1472724 RepID=A0ABV8EPZ0_9BACT|nr:histidine phosphatase family protein [Belliella kenyensis]MCH7400677.1 histidine phosphatase family protein [Belliella kenyensis]MDN3602036.1 histidine phosphatase family protein [Belliella kenyensis]
MKKLILVRHAKSSWDNPFLDDHSRPLSARGYRDAPKMAQRLKRKAIIPDYMLVSDSIRTVSTARIFAQNLRVTESQIHYKTELYHASHFGILDVIKLVPNHVEKLCLVGHNPGFNDLLNFFGFELNNLPTCGVVIFEAELNSWNSISPKKVKFFDYDFPKNS